MDCFQHLVLSIVVLGRYFLLLAKFAASFDIFSCFCSLIRIYIAAVKFTIFIMLVFVFAVLHVLSRIVSYH